MKDIKHLLVIPFLVAVGCVSNLDPPIGEATILRNNTSVRMDPIRSSRTIFTLNENDRVSVIEKQDTWYRIRDQDLIEGWMEESTLLRDSTKEILVERVANAQNLPVQNTARATEPVNLRLDPGRNTTIIRRLPRETTFEVLGRTTTPRQNNGGSDIWLQVRTSQNEVGWVYYQLIEQDIPGPIQPFTEGRKYTAVLRLKEIRSPDGNDPIYWYVVAERRTETAAEIDYDGIRVFIWNLEESQYETTLRLRNLRGSYPLELTGDENQPGFRFYTIGKDGEPATREFTMRGTLPQEIR